MELWPLRSRHVPPYAAIEPFGGWSLGEALLVAFRWALAAVFAVAAFAKARDGSAFAATIRAIGISRGSVWVARLVVVTEALVTIGLLTPAHRIALPVAAALLLVFAVALAQAVWRGVRTRCACFGGASTDSISAASVARAIGLGTVAAFAALMPVPATSEPHDVPELVATATVAFGIYLLCRSIGPLEEAVRMFRRPFVGVARARATDAGHHRVGSLSITEV